MSILVVPFIFSSDKSAVKQLFFYDTTFCVLFPSPPLSTFLSSLSPSFPPSPLPFLPLPFLSSLSPSIPPLPLFFFPPPFPFLFLPLFRLLSLSPGAGLSPFFYFLPLPISLFLLSFLPPPFIFYLPCFLFSCSPFPSSTLPKTFSPIVDALPVY